MSVCFKLGLRGCASLGDVKNSQGRRECSSDIIEKQINA